MSVPEQNSGTFCRPQNRWGRAASPSDGTLSFEPISIAKTEKCKVIVVDHHLASNELPIADAIINPNRADETSLYKYLCAAGVSFIFLVVYIFLIQFLNTNDKKYNHE